MAIEMNIEKGMGKGMGEGAMMKQKIAKIIAIMFMSRTYAHMAHLATSSYAKHKALNDFYDNEDDTDIDIVELADDLAEAAQGMWGKLNIPFEPLDGDVGDPVTALTVHLKRIEQLAANCSEPYIGNIVQEIQKLYRQTLYLLKELN